MSLSVKGLYRFDEYELNRTRRTLQRGGEPVALSPRTFEVLIYLVSNPGRVVTKEELLKAIWPDSFVEESNLAQHISGLRKALAGGPEYIATIPGRGYQFTAEVYAEDPAGNPMVQRMVERTHMVVEESSSPAPEMLALGSGRTRWLGWAVLAVILVAAGAAYIWKRMQKPPQLHLVMVADFLNLAGDPSFDQNLKSAFNVGLEQSPALQIMTEGEAQSALRLMEKSPDTPLLGDTALEVCRRMNYQAVLEGRIESGGNYYKLAMNMVNCASGKTIAVLNADAFNKDDILNTLDGMAAHARKKLGESTQSIDQFHVGIREASTFSFEALKAYDTGSDLGNEGKLKECILYFQKAVDIDPKFAMAQAGLGTAYYDLNANTNATAGEYYQKAFDLSGGVSAPEKLYIRSNYYLIHVRDLDAAVKNYQEWVQLYPGDENAWAGLANAATQEGNFSIAVSAGEHAIQYGYFRTSLNYEILARAYTRVNRYADAKRVLAEAEAQKKDTSAQHMILLRIAIIEQDPQAMLQQIEWNKDQPDLYNSIEYQAISAADHGQYHPAEDLMNSAIQDAVHEGNSGLTDSMLLTEAGVEVELGRTAKAVELLQQVKDKSDADFAVMEARTGNLSAAEAWLQRPEENPHDTLEHFLQRPELKALLALHHGDPASAIAALETSIPYELAECEVIQVRAQAYLAAHQGARAQEEFQKLIDNPGLEDPEMPRTNLAYLGLARAYAMQGRKDDSRKEYEAFFSLWKDADADLPVLRQAHIEYARLSINP